MEKTVYKMKTRQKKLCEILRYLADKFENDPSFDMEKLIHTIYISDMLAYLEFGKSITGLTYYKELSPIGKFK